MKFLICLLFLTSCAMGVFDIPKTEIENKYASAESGSKFIEIDNVRVHYRDEGNKDGPVVVMIHGIVSSLHTWDYWMPTFEKDFRIIRFDVPGFGLSGELDDGHYTPEGYMKFIDDLLTKLKVQKAHMVGSSLGGYFAWMYAAHHPERVNKVILIDPAGYPFNPPWIIRMADWPIIGSASKYVSPRFMAKNLLGEVYGDRFIPTDDVIDRYYEIYIAEGNRDKFQNVFHDILKYVETAHVDIKKIKSPLMVMWGASDRFVPVEQLDLWKRDQPNGTYIKYDGVGHLAMEEIPWLSAIDAYYFLKD